jgi:transcriptional regulator with XRE-family HTH domain
MRQPDKNAGFNLALGQKLRSARKSASLTQNEVATFMELSQDSISKYERGNSEVAPYKLLQFSKLYRKPITFFFMDSMK